MTQTKPETFAKDPNFFFVVATSSTFGRRSRVRVPVFPRELFVRQVRDRAEGDIQRSEDERLGPITR